MVTKQEPLILLKLAALRAALIETVWTAGHSPGFFFVHLMIYLARNLIFHESAGRGFPYFYSAKQNACWKMCTNQLLKIQFL